MQPPADRPLDQRFTTFLRATARRGRRILCPHCGVQVEHAQFQSHAESEHSAIVGHLSEADKNGWIAQSLKNAEPVEPGNVPRAVVDSSVRTRLDRHGSSSRPLSQVRNDVPTSTASMPLTRSSSPPGPFSPKKTREPSSPDKLSGGDAYARPKYSGELWTPDSSTAPRSFRQTPAIGAAKLAQNRPIRSSYSPPVHNAAVTQGQLLTFHPVKVVDKPHDDEPWELLREPGTRPGNIEELILNVKGIYSGITMVEAKSIEVDQAQSADTTDPPAKLTDEQWSALSLLHRTLIYEHHDFFLAIFNPIASDALKKLAEKYSMPARLWKHGMHSFLEILRRRLPESREYMLTFVYQAYSIMSLLYETVHEYKDIWTECLGDLARYRMSIEEGIRENARDKAQKNAEENAQTKPNDIMERNKTRETWNRVSRDWYLKASNMNPNAGRFCHHLAILARPDVVAQLFYYSKSLCVPQPFYSSRESALGLFGPALSNSPSLNSNATPVEAALLRIHAVLWTVRRLDLVKTSLDEYISLLNYIPSYQNLKRGYSKDKTVQGWLDLGKQGHMIGISNCAALVGYMHKDHPIGAMLQTSASARAPEEDSTENRVKQMDLLHYAVLLNYQTHMSVFSRLGDRNALSYLHVVLDFFRFFCQSHLRLLLSQYVIKSVPWSLLAEMLNSFLPNGSLSARHLRDAFPRSEKGEPPQPLREDFALRALIWNSDFPDDWFSDEDLDQPHIDPASVVVEREDRVLWQAARIAQSGVTPLGFDLDKKLFVLSPYGSHDDAVVPMES